jgi:UDPglucose 6-dehydrogenase
VPTPYNNGIDLSAVNETLKKLADRQNKIIVIKSTVIIGTTEKLQAQYPNLKILFNPEFLDNNTAIQDFAKPDKQIVGFTEQSKAIAPEILEMLPDAPYKKIMPARAAEMVKYMVNTYYTTKVIFGNLIYDICQATGVDYDQVRKAFESDRRVAPGNFDVWHGGFRGFAGKCLPKDLESFIEFADENGVDLGLLKEVKKINDKLIKNSNNQITNHKIF